MPLIIDTYNVLHVTGVLPPDLAGIEAEGLIELLQGSRYRREDVILVCDGHPAPGSPKGRFGTVRVRFAGSGLTADDLIRQIVDRSSIPRRLIVVTSDREILRAVRKRRCQTMSSEQFLQQLTFDSMTSRSSGSPVSRTSEVLSEAEIQQWTREFDVDEDAIEKELPELNPLDEDISKDLADQETIPAAQTPSDQDSTEPVPPPSILPPDLLREAEQIVDEAKQKSPSDIPPSYQPPNPDTMDP